MIRKITPEEFERAAHKASYTSVLRDIDEFEQMEDKFCEVDTKRYKNAGSAASSYRQTIKRINVDIDVINHGGRVFMVKGAVK